MDRGSDTAPEVRIETTDKTTCENGAPDGNASAR